MKNWKNMNTMAKRIAAMACALVLLLCGTALADGNYWSGAVDLVTMNAYYTGDITLFSSIKDTMGNRYGTGMRGYMEPGTPNCYNIWDIGGRYSTLTATCIIRSQDKGSQHVASFRIYGDGMLLYQQSNITSMTKPFPICVDVRGVTDLKIEMFGNGNMGTHGIDSVLVDVMLHP